MPVIDGMYEKFVHATGSRFDRDNERYVRQVDRMSRLPYFKERNGHLRMHDNHSNIFVNERVFGYLLSMPDMCNDLHRRFNKAGLFITSLDIPHAVKFANGETQNFYCDVVLPWFRSNVSDDSKTMAWYSAWRFLKTGTYGGMFVETPLVGGGVKRRYEFIRHVMFYQNMNGSPFVGQLDAQTALRLAVRDSAYNFRVHT